MSEIKGQILGIVLVLMVFGAVATTMITVFNGLTSAVTEKTNDVKEDLDTY